MTLRHTRPDFGAASTEFPSSGYSQDTLEAMARIGAPNNRRSGRVLYATGFEQGFDDWTPVSSSGGVSPNNWVSLWRGDAGVSVPRTYRGSSSLKIVADTVADADGDKYAQAIKLLAPIWSGNIAAEITFGISAGLTHFALFFVWRQLGGGVSEERKGAILFDFANALMKRLTTGTGGVGGSQWQSIGSIPGGDMRPSLGTSIRWANLKLVLSSTLTQYHRLFFNRYDLSSLIDGLAAQISTPGAATFETLQVYPRAYDQAGAGNYAIIDDVIVTQDES